MSRREALAVAEFVVKYIGRLTEEGKLLRSKMGEVENLERMHEIAGTLEGFARCAGIAVAMLEQEKGIVVPQADRHAGPEKSGAA